jgi:phospholipid/cholesterol/gamma-HCH transport system substrate-binding protein
MKISYEVRFGILAVIAIVALVFGASYMQGKRIFGSSLTLYAKYENVGGLIKGNAVLINGVTVGQVMETQYQDSVVLVEIKLDEDWFIPADSYAEIFAKDLIGVGGKAMQIIKGSSSDRIKNEGFIEGRMEKGMFDELGENAEETFGDLPEDLKVLFAKLSSVVSKLDSTMTIVMEQDETQSILRNVDQSLANLNKVTAELAETMPKVKEISSNLADNGEKINETMANVTTLTDSLAASSADLRAAAASAKTALEGVDEIVTELKGTEGSIGKLINQDDLYQDLNGTVQSVKALVDSVKKRPQKYLDVDVYLIERKKKE